MKKLLTIIFLCVYFMASAQIKLASHTLDLKKSSSHHQILNAVNTANQQVVIFAADKENCYVTKYNSAFFFSDSLTVKRPEKTYDFMTGYSFENGVPTLYWTSENRKKIAAVEYNFEARQSKTTEYEIELESETFLSDFVINNVYYILTLPKTTESLKLYVFKNKIRVIKTIDISALHFTDDKNKTSTLSEILQENPLEKFESDLFHPLPIGVSKSKLFVLENRLVFTLDHNSSETQTFEIDLNTFEITEKKFTQVASKKESKSNSYYHNNKLYQLKVSGDEIALTAKDYKSSAIISNYSTTKDNTINFKNSPFFIQTGNQKPREVKTVKKFFRNFAASHVGLTVYQNRDNLLVTIGGCSNVATTGEILLGISVGIATAVYGTGGDIGALYEDNTLQVVYFESLLDNKLQHSNHEPQPLAIDFIGGFLNDLENYALDSVFRYKGYYVLGYYDTKANEYRMWKFEDGK